MLLTLSLSNVVGAVIPVIIHKFKIDPAVASGPFITTINDALGLIIYFSIATQLLHLL
ncbi:magnesium transporter [Jeotgalibaca porci]|uniref:magnesium transporter n=1 Tax=Jeotgalibaca porci TaxID=1868793 RepID=UPI0035A096DE